MPARAGRRAAAEGWGAGRARSGRPSEGGGLQLSLDFDAVGGPAADGRRRRRRRSRRRRPAAVEPADDLPTALAAAIADPGRIEVHAGRPDRRARAVAGGPGGGRASGSCSTIRDRAAARRWRSPSPARTAGSSRSTEPDDAADACAGSSSRLGDPARRRTRSSRSSSPRFADDPGRAGHAGRLRHADRRLHPERGPPQPDHRRRRRRAARPDPAAAAELAGAARAGLEALSALAVREPLERRAGRRRPRAPVPRDRAAARSRSSPGWRRPASPLDLDALERPGPGVRRRDLAARAGDLRRRRARVQPRQPQAARADPVLRAATCPRASGPRPATRPTRRCSRSSAGATR